MNQISMTGIFFIHLLIFTQLYNLASCLIYGYSLLSIIITASFILNIGNG